MPDADPPELGNEDGEFIALVARARTATLPLFLLAADPPSRDDTASVQEAKAVAVAEAFAGERGAAFGGVLPPGKRRKGRAA